MPGCNSEEWTLYSNVHNISKCKISIKVINSSTLTKFRMSSIANTINLNPLTLKHEIRWTIYVNWLTKIVVTSTENIQVSNSHVNRMSQYKMVSGKSNYINRISENWRDLTELKFCMEYLID